MYPKAPTIKPPTTANKTSQKDQQDLKQCCMTLLLHVIFNTWLKWDP